jgi:hypothetical protein
MRQFHNRPSNRNSNRVFKNLDHHLLLPLYFSLKWLLERKDLDALSSVIPIVDRLTKILIDIGETHRDLGVMAEYERSD